MTLIRSQTFREGEPFGESFEILQGNRKQCLFSAGRLLNVMRFDVEYSCIGGWNPTNILSDQFSQFIGAILGHLQPSDLFSRLNTISTNFRSNWLQQFDSESFGELWQDYRQQRDRFLTEDFQEEIGSPPQLDLFFNDAIESLWSSIISNLSENEQRWFSLGYFIDMHLRPRQPWQSLRSILQINATHPSSANSALDTEVSVPVNFIDIGSTTNDSERITWRLRPPRIFPNAIAQEFQLLDQQTADVGFSHLQSISELETEISSRVVNLSTRTDESLMPNAIEDYGNLRFNMSGKRIERRDGDYRDIGPGDQSFLLTRYLAKRGPEGVTNEELRENWNELGGRNRGEDMGDFNSALRTAITRANKRLKTIDYAVSYSPEQGRRYLLDITQTQPTFANA